MSEAQATPAANDGGPTPQMIGIRFVKTYYQVLSSTPDNVFKFYKPSSVLSHGEGSTPASAVDFEKYNLKDRWGDAQRFDFDNGAIDAQPSSDGSILLSVTGHVLVKVDGNEERKGFVHTILLALVSLPNKQKTYYVKNDILRFLKPDGAADTDAARSSPTPEPVVAVSPEPKEEPAPEEQPAVIEETPSKEEKKEEDAPAAVVEEKAEDAPKEEPKAEEAAPAGEKPKEAKEEPAKESNPEPKKKEKGKRQRGRAKSPQDANAAKQQPASKPAPGSWASLVASGSGPPTTPAPQAASTPSKPKPAPAPEKKTETPKAAAPAPKKEDKADAPKENGKSHKDNKDKDKPKRDPDNTLVIKNLPDGTKEAELLAIFEPFAAQTNAKIVSSTISSHRGLAFVDYDSVAPVLKAVELHAKEPIQLNGKVLEVDQKTAEQRARKANRGGYRSGSPNNRGGGGGGRQNKRNNGGRGGGGKGNNNNNNNRGNNGGGGNKEGGGGGGGR